MWQVSPPNFNLWLCLGIVLSSLPLLAVEPRARLASSMQRPVLSCAAGPLSRHCALRSSHRMGSLVAPSSCCLWHARSLPSRDWVYRQPQAYGVAQRVWCHSRSRSRQAAAKFYFSSQVQTLVLSSSFYMNSVNFCICTQFEPVAVRCVDIAEKGAPLHAHVYFMLCSASEARSVACATAPHPCRSRATTFKYQGWLCRDSCSLWQASLGLPPTGRLHPVRTTGRPVRARPCCACARCWALRAMSRN